MRQTTATRVCKRVKSLYSSDIHARTNKGASQIFDPQILGRYFKIWTEGVRPMYVYTHLYIWQRPTHICMVKVMHTHIFIKADTHTYIYITHDLTSSHTCYFFLKKENTHSLAMCYRSKTFWMYWTHCCHWWESLRDWVE